MPGEAVMVNSSNGKDGYAMARAPPRTRSFPVNFVRPLLLCAVLATGFLVAGFLLFLGDGGFAASYYRLPSFALPDVLLAAGKSAPCTEVKEEVERWWARPPARSAWHNMSDEELLWAASFEPRARPLRQPSMPRKVAFLFLTRGPLPLAPLWERFFNGTGTGGSGTELFSVYVHTTPGYRPDFPPSSPFYGRQVPSKTVEWGKPSVVDAERRLLANALLDLDNERFVLVSESCIPLRPLSTVHAYLTRSVHSFVHSFVDPGPGGQGRYRAGMAPEVSISQWRKGSQWFEIQRSHAVFVVADDLYYPKFREVCRPSCYVDEHYLPTALTIVTPGSIANRSVTWVDWSPGIAHPPSFGAEDLGEELLDRLAGKKENERCMYNWKPAEVCFLFARKFKPSALQPLLELSSRFFGY